MTPTLNEATAGRNYWCDCLRGYAILLVCVSHLFYVEPIADKLGFMKHYLKGDTGVYIFYVLSGFLVTGILAREVTHQPSVQTRLRAVGHFFARRAFRLQPSNLLFLTLYYLLPAQPAALPWWALFLPLSNWLTGPYITWHLKTLHIEETYYASIGSLSSIFRKRLKSLLWWLLILGPLGRVAIFTLTKCGFESAGWLLDRYLPVETFAVGGLLSFYLEQIRAFKVIKVLVGKPALTFAAAMSGLLLASALRDVRPFSQALVLTWPLIFSGLSLVMILTGLDRRKFLFSANWLRLLGLMSYTVYLFQQFILGPWSEIYTAQFSWTVWGGVVLASFALVPLWYWYIEKPLTDLGSRMFPRIHTVPSVPALKSDDRQVDVVPQLENSAAMG
jgi:peptidoglycan/LPS O-acetylase OafA/YrhL